MIWSKTQLNRLKALNADASDLNLFFENGESREKKFRELSKALTIQLRNRLNQYKDDIRRPSLDRLAQRLCELLVGDGFSQVSTPIIMSKGHLEKMSIDDNHPLSRQVFWLDKNKCLRPMLAPHLYYVSKDLLRLWSKPVRLFEVGPCFRKESKGARHASEFTMLNLVEYGTPEDQKKERLEHLAQKIMAGAEIDDYFLEFETSEVYGDTIDVVGGKDKTELASAAMGPHSLDSAWGITDTWVGIGFGLERLLMVKNRSRTIAKYGRSLTFLDGIPLNL